MWKFCFQYTWRQKPSLEGYKVEICFKLSFGVILVGPVGKTPLFQGRGHQFDLGWGTKIPHVVWPRKTTTTTKTKKKKLSFNVLPLILLYSLRVLLWSFLLWWMVTKRDWCFSVSKSCLTLCNHMENGTLGSCPWGSPGKNNGVGCCFLLQGSSWPRDRICLSCSGRQILYLWATREALRRGLPYTSYYMRLLVVHLTSLYSLPLTTAKLILPQSHRFWVFLGDLLTNLS